MGGTRSSGGGAGVGGAGSPTAVAEVGARYPRASGQTQAIAIARSIEGLLDQRDREGASPALDEEILNRSAQTVYGETFEIRRAKVERLLNQLGERLWKRGFSRNLEIA